MSDVTIKCPYCQGVDEYCLDNYSCDGVYDGQNIELLCVECMKAFGITIEVIVNASVDSLECYECGTNIPANKVEEAGCDDGELRCGSCSERHHIGSRF